MKLIPLFSLKSRSIPHKRTGFGWRRRRREGGGQGGGSGRAGRGGAWRAGALENWHCTMHFFTASASPPHLISIYLYLIDISFLISSSSSLIPSYSTIPSIHYYTETYTIIYSFLFLPETLLFLPTFLFGLVAFAFALCCLCWTAFWDIYVISPLFRLSLINRVNHQISSIDNHLETLSRHS